MKAQATYSIATGLFGMVGVAAGYKILVAIAVVAILVIVIRALYKALGRFSGKLAAIIAAIVALAAIFLVGMKGLGLLLLVLPVTAVVGTVVYRAKK